MQAKISEIRENRLVGINTLYSNGGIMSQKVRLILYIVLMIIIVGSIFLVWAFDTGRIFGSADVVEPAVTSAEKLKILPAPDQSTFGDWFGKVVGWFGR